MPSPGAQLNHAILMASSVYVPSPLRRRRVPPARLVVTVEDEEKEKRVTELSGAVARPPVVSLRGMATSA